MTLRISGVTAACGDSVLTITGSKFLQPDSAKQQRSRVFIFDDAAETRTPALLSSYRALVREHLAVLGLPSDVKLTWRQTAGCSCGCSPGFVADRRLLGDLFIDVARAARAEVSR